TKFGNCTDACRPAGDESGALVALAVRTAALRTFSKGGKTRTGSACEDVVSHGFLYLPLYFSDYWLSDCDQVDGDDVLIGVRHGPDLQPQGRAGTAETTLTLYKATDFWSRLRGLHVLPPLLWGTGLYLSPCWAIHTFRLPYAIDVVFLNDALQELRRVDAIQPNRVAFCWGAASVVELPGGFCASFPGYAAEIHKALTANDSAVGELGKLA